jgi:hypothetical protein
MARLSVRRALDEQHLDDRTVRHERGGPPPRGLRLERRQCHEHRRAPQRRWHGAGRAPRAYAPLELVQTASAGGGSQTTVTTATTAVSDSQAPFANQNGLVAAPNVDLSQEMVGQMIASYSFAANATVMKADDRMTKTLLNITA